MEQVPKVLRDLFENYGPEIINQMPKLTLRANSLSSFPSELFRCSGLRHLNLGNNTLSELPAEQMLAQLPQLVELDLSDNHFQSYDLLGVDHLGKMKHLANLDIRRNPLKAINQRLELINILVFDSTIPSGPCCGWLPARSTVPAAKSQSRLIKDVVKDPKRISSVKASVHTKPGEGPIAISKRLSESLRRPVHYCDMNVCPVPRATGRFKMLTKLNGINLSVEDLDAAVDALRVSVWYDHYPRTQCQKQLKCSIPMGEDERIDKYQRAEKRQVDAEMRRFHHRLTTNKGRLPRSSIKGIKEDGSIVKRIAAKRAVKNQAKEAAALKAAEHKVMGSVEALLKFGHLDGGMEDEVDKAWVMVRDPDEEDSDEEMSYDEAEKVLKKLKFKSLAREVHPAHEQSLLGQEEDTSLADEEREQQGQSKLFLTKDKHDLTIPEAAHRELADSRSLVQIYQKENPTVYFKPYMGLNHKEYLSLLEEDQDEDEMRVSKAAAKRKASMEAAVAQKVKKGWDKKRVSLHELIVKMFQKQRIQNDETVEALEDQIAVYYEEKRNAASWDRDLAAKTADEVKREEHELKAECDSRFRVKPVNMKKELASCHLAGKYSSLAANSASIETEKTKQRYHEHRARLEAIKKGTLQFPQPISDVPSSEGGSTRRDTNSSADEHSEFHHSIDRLPLASNGWTIASISEKIVDEDYTKLLEASVEVRKTIVDDLKSLQYKTRNFKADAKEVDPKMEDDFYMMNQYYARRETSIEDQKLMIGDSEFIYSPMFKSARAEAQSDRKNILHTMSGVL